MLFHKRLHVASNCAESEALPSTLEVSESEIYEAEAHFDGNGQCKQSKINTPSCLSKRQCCLFMLIFPFGTEIAECSEINKFLVSYLLIY